MCRIEIHRRGCCRPRNKDLKEEGVLRTSCARHPRTRAKPTIHNRRSKRKAGHATEAGDKRGRRLIPPWSRRLHQSEWIALAFRDANAEHRTSNIEHPTSNVE